MNVKLVRAPVSSGRPGPGPVLTGNLSCGGPASLRIFRLRESNYFRRTIFPIMTIPATLDTPVEQVRGISGKRGEALRGMGIHTVRDLFYHLPRRYLDRSRILPIGRLPLDREVTLIGRVCQVSFISGPRPRLTLTVEDEGAEIACVWFQGARYMRHNFKEEDVLALSGKVHRYRGSHRMVHPEYEFVAVSGDQDLLHTGAIVPLYTTSAEMKERGLRTRTFRRLMSEALETFEDGIRDELEEEIRERLGLPGLAQSLRRVHFPRSMEDVRRARRRLAFDEFFRQQLQLARLRRHRLGLNDGIVFRRSEILVPALVKSLPFDLTRSQQRVMDEILQDMAQPFPMSRLLQGDVGTGKTIIALCAMLNAVDNGCQATLMAPTEILAEQHFLNIRSLVEPLGAAVVLLVGGQGPALRRELLHGIRNGVADIVVGTHALIQDQVEFHQLGLVVVDEQHRFGVIQRSELSGKGRRADVLTMTATPIPRTLALTLYGDLDISVVDELPPGRKSVRTVLRREDRRELIFAFVADQIRRGRQAYVIYPLVEESEKRGLKSAVEAFAELQRGLLRGFRVGLLHGRMRAEEKSAVMDDFKAGGIQVLVSTTVIEVGIDVPNATLMVVEHAERFGLAQLHQLRGRVGRGAQQSYCILITRQNAVEAADAIRRLRTLCRTQDGFEIARKDLELRGPGELFGTRQAGLREFAVDDLVEGEKLLTLARREALRVVESA